MQHPDLPNDTASPEQAARKDLAATFRWFDRLGMSEAIANHFSYALDPGGERFLMNPYGVHWGTLKAQDLLTLEAAHLPDDLRDRVDPTGWSIHGAIRRNVPGARCVMHLHSRYATALSILKDPSLPPLDQTSMRFYNRVEIDLGFDGMGLAEEGERLSTLLKEKRILMMGQHGVLVVNETIAGAFDDIYHFERACETYLIAAATGKELNPAPAEIAEKTARQWEDYPGFAERHLAAVRKVLDVQDPDYAV